MINDSNSAMCISHSFEGLWHRGSVFPYTFSTPSPHLPFLARVRLSSYLPSEILAPLCVNLEPSHGSREQYRGQILKLGLYHVYIVTYCILQPLLLSEYADSGSLAFPTQLLFAQKATRGCEDPVL